MRELEAQLDALRGEIVRDLADEAMVEVSLHEAPEQQAGLWIKIKQLKIEMTPDDAHRAQERLKHLAGPKLQDIQAKIARAESIRSSFVRLHTMLRPVETIGQASRVAAACVYDSVVLLLRGASSALDTVWSGLAYGIWTVVEGVRMIVGGLAACFACSVHHVFSALNSVRASAIHRLSVSPVVSSVSQPEPSDNADDVERLDPRLEI